MRNGSGNGLDYRKCWWPELQDYIHQAKLFLQDDYGREGDLLSLSCHSVAGSAIFSVKG